MGQLFAIVLTSVLLAPVIASGKAQPPADPPDPIATLAEILNAREDGGMWTNGVSPNIQLPEDAKPDAVVVKYFAAVSFDQGKAKDVHVRTAREVTINDVRYTVALVDTSLGPKLLVMRRERTMWWTKMFAVERLEDLRRPAQKPSK